MGSKPGKVANEHGAEILMFPDPKGEEPWAIPDLPRPARQIFRKLHNQDFIVDKGKDPSDSNRKVWEVHPKLYQKAKEACDYRKSLPNCDHPRTGFENLGDGEYACTTCGEVYGRDTIEEYFG